MKMKKLTALLLVLASLAMMTLLCAAAPGAAYSTVTVSNKGVRLEQPRDGDYFEEPVTAYAKASRRGGAIYIMPRPEAGNGNLGTVADGTKLTLLAERGGFYFFELENGQQGWNGTKYFTLSETPVRKADSAWSEVSDQGVALEMPREEDYYDQVYVGYVKSSRRGGAIYFMPKPKSGNGNLGTVADGTKVYIYAERNDCYFFETEDGRMGWNGKQFFGFG